MSDFIGCLLADNSSDSNLGTQAHKKGGTQTEAEAHQPLHHYQETLEAVKTGIAGSAAEVILGAAPQVNLPFRTHRCYYKHAQVDHVPVHETIHTSLFTSSPSGRLVKLLAFVHQAQIKNCKST